MIRQKFPITLAAFMALGINGMTFAFFSAGLATPILFLTSYRAICRSEALNAT